LVGCGGGQPTRNSIIDEASGTYRGLGLGDSRRAVQRKFGPPAPFDPDQAIGGPPTITPPGPLTQEAARTDHTLRYRGVSFSVIRGSVYAVIVTASGAQTRRGVAIGDPFARVKDEYPQADCEPAEGGLISERDYPYCTIRIRRDRYLFFSHDPISDITMTINNG
jgi:hypothetical protein